MDIQTIISNIKANTASEMQKVDASLSPSTAISDEVKQRFVDAGVRGTLDALSGLPGASLTYVNTDDEDKDRLFVEPKQLLDAYFDGIND